MKILFFTSFKQSCGIADYADRLAEALVAHGHQVTFFESPTSLIGQPEDKYREAMKSLHSLALLHDVLHIQHEFSFFKPWQVEILGEMLTKKGERPYKTIVTLHTTPKPTKPIQSEAGFWSRLLGKVTSKILRTNDVDYAVRSHLQSFANFDRILVHSKFGRNQLKKFNILNPKRIKVIPMPIQNSVDKPAESEVWKSALESLQFTSGDILILVPGFISGAKGQISAVKSLSLLPSNVKLILAGGVHPIGRNHTELDVITDEIISRNLQSRILYTGYLAESDLSFFAFKADIVLLPYDPNYESSSAIVGEALRFGKPVVATRTRGFVELAEIIPSVKLCDSAAYADIARAIVETLKSPPGDADFILNQAHALSYSEVAKSIVELFYSPKATSNPPKP